MNPYNIAVAVGRLTADPEIRYTKEKKAVARFRLAVNDGKDRAQFLNCVAFGKTAEIIDQHFRKGSGILVVGENTVSAYEKDGQKRSRYELRVDSIGFPPSKKETYGESKTTSEAFSDLEGDDADLPF